MALVQKAKSDSGELQLSNTTKLNPNSTQPILPITNNTTVPC